MLPSQLAAAALTAWYGSMRQTIMLPRMAPQIRTFNRPFAFETTYLTLGFHPSAPNLASRSMCLALVEWLEERAARGLVELFDAVVESDWGTVVVKFGLKDGYALSQLIGGVGEAVNRGSGTSGGDLK